MFTKTTLAKCALAPLAAATVLSSTLASASPAPAPTLQARGDTTYTTPASTWTTTSSSSSYAPQKTGDCDCDKLGWDKDHVPKVTQPNKDAVWKVGSQQKVTWDAKWDGQKNGTSDGGKGWDDGKKRDDDDGKDGKEEGCTPRLFLRKGDAIPFLILAEGFDLKSGSTDVTVPNVFFGTDYSVTLSFQDDKPELQSNSEKFKIGKDDKDYSDFCKDGKDKDGKDCKDWQGGNKTGNGY